MISMKEEGITAEDAYNVILKVNDQTYGIPGEMKYNLVLINKICWTRLDWRFLRWIGPGMTIMSMPRS